MGVGLVVGLVSLDKLSSLVDCLEDKWNDFDELIDVVTVGVLGHVVLPCAAEWKTS